MRIRFAAVNNEFGVDARLAARFRLWIAMLGSLLAAAGDASAGQGITGHVIEVNIPASGAYVRFQLDVAPINPDGCGPLTTLPGVYMIEISPGTTAADRFVAALLTASATGKTVSFWLSGCTAGQYWGGTRPMAFDIYLVN